MIEYIVLCGREIPLPQYVKDEIRPFYKRGFNLKKTPVGIISEIKDFLKQAGFEEEMKKCRFSIIMQKNMFNNFLSKEFKKFGYNCYFIKGVENE